METPCGHGSVEYVANADDFTFPNLEDVDLTVRVNGREIGNLLPGHIVNPMGSWRGGTTLSGFGDIPYSGRPQGRPIDRGGLDVSMGRVNDLSNWIPNSYNFAPGPGNLNALGLCGVTGSLHSEQNPYNPRVVCPSRCWCPGGGLGLPCCPTDTYTGGHVQRTTCPKNLCESRY